MEKKKINKMKDALAILAAVVAVIGTHIVCEASDTSFSNAYVDSNTYSYVTSATALQYSSTADVLVTNILKADGSASNYKQVYCKATGSGTPVLVTKGSYYTLTVPISNRGEGKSIGLYAMGNNPSLDCRISGIWKTH